MVTNSNIQESQKQPRWFGDAMPDVPGTKEEHIIHQNPAKPNAYAGPNVQRRAGGLVRWRTRRALHTSAPAFPWIAAGRLTEPKK